MWISILFIIVGIALVSMGARKEVKGISYKDTVYIKGKLYRLDVYRGIEIPAGWTTESSMQPYRYHVFIYAENAIYYKTLVRKPRWLKDNGDIVCGGVYKEIGIGDKDDIIDIYKSKGDWSKLIFNKGVVCDAKDTIYLKIKGS